MQSRGVRGEGHITRKYLTKMSLFEKITEKSQKITSRGGFRSEIDSVKISENLMHANDLCKIFN